MAVIELHPFTKTVGNATQRFGKGHVAIVRPCMRSQAELLQNCGHGLPAKVSPWSRLWPCFRHSRAPSSSSTHL